MYYGLQKGGIAAMKLDQSWFENLNATYKKRREILWKILDKLNYSYDKNAVGLFVWAKLPKGEHSEEVSDNLLYNKNIFVTPGSKFGANGTGHLRFSLCTNETELKNALQRVE
jgi:aspartate/methionine/tyrosine aminotransferase